MTDGEDVWKFVARSLYGKDSNIYQILFQDMMFSELILFTYLDSSVLDLFWNLLAELALGLALYCKIRMMSGIALDTNAPTLFGHSKHECPSIFWVQVSIGKDQKTLVLFKIDILFQVFENLPSMILLRFRVLADSCGYNALALEIAQTESHVIPSCSMWAAWGIAGAVCLNLANSHASEKDFDRWFHIVDEHLLEVLLICLLRWINVVVPHFKYDNFWDAPIFTLFLKFL